LTLKILGGIVGWPSNQYADKTAGVSDLEDKADKILMAVRSVLAEKGYQGATISEIAQEAGISRGLLHYYFKSKEDMLCQVIRHSMAGILARTSAILESAQSPAAAAEGLCSALRGILVSDPHFFKLFLEAWVFARKGPDAQSLLKDIHSRFRQAVRRGLEGLAQKTGQPPASTRLDTLATLLTSLVDGIGMQATIEPSLLENDDLWNALDRAIFALLEHAR
jgi:AcrR family transcriptional regulator